MENGTANDKAASAYLRALRRGEAGYRNKPPEPWGVNVRGFTDKHPQKGSFTNLHYKDSIEQMPYLSTSHYLRGQLGMEKPVQDSRKSNSSKSGKQIEDYIDELTVLKKEMATVKTENHVLKAKIRQFEDDITKKDKELETFLASPPKGQMSLRKAELVQQLNNTRLRLLRMEHLSKQREQEIQRFQSDLKSSQIDELRLQTETYFAEIQRLNNLIKTQQQLEAAAITQSEIRSAGSRAPADTSNGALPPTGRSLSARPRSGSIGGGSDIDAQLHTSAQSQADTIRRLRALNTQLFRLNDEKNRALAENRKLCAEVDRFREEWNEVQVIQRRYDDMDRASLAKLAAKLKYRLRQSEKEVNGMRFDKGLPIRQERLDSPPPPEAEGAGGQESARDEEREREMDALVRKTIANAPLDPKLVVPQWPPAASRLRNEQKRDAERFRFQARLLDARETQLLAELERRNRFVADLKEELSTAKVELEDKRKNLGDLKLRFEQQSSEYQRRLSEYDLKLVRLEQMRASSALAQRHADEKDGAAASSSDAEKRVQREPQQETKRREEREREREREDATRWQHEKLLDESIQRREDELAAARKAEPRAASAAEPERKRKPELPTSNAQVDESMNLLANALRGHMARREHLRRVQNEQKDEQQTRETDAPRAERRPSSRSSAPAPPKRGTPAADADTTQRQQRVDSPAYDEAVALLQSALQGHSKRQNFLQQQRRGSHART